MSRIMEHEWNFNIHDCRLLDYAENQDEADEVIYGGELLYCDLCGMLITEQPGVCVVTAAGYWNNGAEQSGIICTECVGDQLPGYTLGVPRNWWEIRHTIVIENRREKREHGNR